MRKPKNLIKALQPFFSPRKTQQGHVDVAARARVFYLKGSRELLLSPEGRGFHVTVIEERNDTSFGDGPFFNDAASAAQLKDWISAENDLLMRYVRA